MRVKTCPVTIKAAGTHEGTDEGVFEALVSVFSNVDHVGDVVHEGAFAASLKAWEDSGDPIPVIWSHQHDDPDSHIGSVLEAKETDGGLWVKGQLDMDEPKAAKVYKLLKGRRVRQFSFAYDMDAPENTPNDHGGFDLHKLGLFEVGPTLIPANAETELLAVKRTPAEEEAAGTREVAVGGGDQKPPPTDTTSQDADEDEPPEESGPEKTSVTLTFHGGWTAAEKQRIADAATAAAAVALGVEAAPGLPIKAGRTLSAKNEKALRDSIAKISEGVALMKDVLAAVDRGQDDDGKARTARSADGEPAEATVEEQAPAKTDKPKPAPDKPTSPTPASIRQSTDPADWFDGISA